MRTIFLIWAFIFLTDAVSCAQPRHVPRDLKQALKLLDRDCPDSLKTLIKTVEDRNIRKLSYPFGGSYLTIYNWTSGENENSRIVKYLNSQGITANHIEIILLAFKQELLGKPLNENKLLKPFHDLEATWSVDDKNRFTADTLAGVYIPKDIDDCIAKINTFWPDSIKERWKHLSEREFSGQLHLGFGMWMRNNWQLWAGSRLSNYFCRMGIFNPEDMSGIILNGYHRTLNGKEVDLEGQVKQVQDYWKESEKAENNRMRAEFVKYKISDTLEYQYSLGYASKKQEAKAGDYKCIATGIVINADTSKLTIKVRLLQSCDIRGIIYYDNNNYKVFDKETNSWGRPKRRIIKYMKKGQQLWFDYNKWDLK